MEKTCKERVSKKKTLLHSKGITYFDKKTERNFFFVSTIAILVWGILEKFAF